MNDWEIRLQDRKAFGKTKKKVNRGKYTCRRRRKAPPSHFLREEVQRGGWGAFLEIHGDKKPKGTCFILEIRGEVGEVKEPAMVEK